MCVCVRVGVCVEKRIVGGNCILTIVSGRLEEDLFFYVTTSHLNKSLFSLFTEKCELMRPGMTGLNEQDNGLTESQRETELILVKRPYRIS